jgi:hypothetical protein
MITQSNYIPWKGYFDAIRAVDWVVLYDDVQFTRRDWRNRNRIKTPQGVQWLTIPVEVKGKFFQKINETRISDPGWANRHWRTLELNYRRAPFFDWCEGAIRPLYDQAEMPLLSDINFYFLQELTRLLGIEVAFLKSGEFQPDADRNERLVQICLELGASVYYTGPSAKAYLDESVFGARGIEVRYFDFSGYPEYPQLFNGFDHHVSILDLMFNVGSRATDYMKDLRQA